MVLLAIILIGAGLACLGFVGYSLLKGGALGPGAPATASGAPGPGAPSVSPVAADRSPAVSSSGERSAGASVPVPPGVSGNPPDVGLPNAGRESGRSVAFADERGAVSGRGVPTSLTEAPASGPAIGLDLRERQELNFLRDRLTGLQRIDTDSLNESLRVIEKTERESPAPAPQLIVTGVLFLDHGRKIPGQLGRRGEIPTRVFSELRRVGNGTLILEGSSFMIHCGNTSYSYSAGDLDQILFQGSGLALVPIHPDRPIPLFLTTDVDAVKAYIKKNARIRSL